VSGAVAASTAIDPRTPENGKRYDERAASLERVGHAMAAALVLMLVACADPSPTSIGVFFGFGLPLAALAIGAFGWYVLRDLRSRRAL
jgi:hypothetical protein